MNLHSCDVFCTKGRRSLGSGQSLQGWVTQGSEGFVQSSRAPLWYHSPHWPFCVEISSDFHWIQRDGQESLSNTTRKFSVHYVWLDITEHFTPFLGWPLVNDRHCPVYPLTCRRARWPMVKAWSTHTRQIKTRLRPVIYVSSASPILLMTPGISMTHNKLFNRYRISEEESLSS